MKATNFSFVHTSYTWKATLIARCQSSSSQKDGIASSYLWSFVTCHKYLEK